MIDESKRIESADSPERRINFMWQNKTSLITGVFPLFVHRSIRYCKPDFVVLYFSFLPVAASAPANETSETISIKTTVNKLLIIPLLEAVLQIQVVQMVEYPPDRLTRSQEPTVQ